MGITFPSAQMQQMLYEEIYSECGVDPKTIAFMEAHGTGTKVGDPEELMSIDKIFCTGRNKPLPVGSVKSNIGHSEPSSGLASVTKAIIAMETGYLPPNINFNKAREEADSLMSGRLQVVTEKQAWEGGLIGVNSFGFGGANCHVLLKWNEKSKPLTLSDNDTAYPRLVCISGRNQQYIDTFFNDIKSNPIDIEQIRLLHEIHQTDVLGHLQRAYLMLAIDKQKRATVLHEKRTKYFSSFRKHFILKLYDRVDGNLAKVWTQFYEVELFKKAVTKLLNDFDLKNPKLLLLLLQIGLIDIFKNIGLEFVSVTAQSYAGIIAALYYEDIITLKDVFSMYNLSEKNALLQIKKLISKSQKLINDDNEYDNKNIDTGIMGIEVIDPIYSRKIKNYAINCRETLLMNLGELYLHGANLRVHLLYPHIEYPVSRGTRMLAPLVEWNHDRDWFITYFNIQEKISSGERSVRISSTNEEYAYLAGHVIDGRNLVPATCYLEMVWETLALMKGQIYQEVSIVFENVKFLRATHIPKQGNLNMLIMIHKVTGKFEVFKSLLIFTF